MKPTLSKLIVAISVLVAGNLPIHSGEVLAASKAPSKSGVLQLVISGLEMGAVARVLITGPHFDKVATKTEMLKGLVPGNYLLEPEKVTEKSGVESPGTVTHVTVIRGKVATGTALYFFIPRTTISVTSQQTVSFTGPITGAQVLTLSAPSEVISPGEILASGPTPSRPQGYIVKVTSVSTAGTIVTADVIPATLAEAIPDGSLDLTEAFSELNSIFSANSTDSSSSKLSRSLAAHDFTSQFLNCQGGGQVSVTPSLGLSFNGGIANVGWSLAQAGGPALGLTGHVSVDYSISASLNVEASASADCMASLPLLEGTAGTFVVDAGIPIVLTPTYSLQLIGSASVFGSLDDTFGERLGVSMTAGYPPSFTSAVNSISSTSNLSGDVQASLDIGVQASLGVEVDGVAGLTIDAGPELKFTANPSATPTWTLQGCLEGGFSVSLAVFTVINEPSAISWCQLLAQATNKPPTVTTSTTVLSPITVASDHACLLKTNNTVECWGSNGAGQLGNGTQINSSTPVSVLGLTSVKQVSAADGETCAVTEAGAVDCWGAAFTLSPETVPNLSGVKQVAVEPGYECALLTNTSVKCWGMGIDGELGDGSTSSSTTPVTVSNLTGVAEISSGLDNACALLTRGTVECWGYNAQGELGNGSTTNSSIPVQVSNLTGVRSISSETLSTCALLSSGSISCWGSNIGEAVYGNTDVDSLTPITFTSISNVSQVANADSVSCVLLSSGTVECWGIGTAAVTESPSVVLGLTGATNISAGGDEACAELVSGQIYCWGSNQYGQLGNGSNVDSSTPVEVTGT